MLENKLRAERGQICETIVDGAHDSRIVENSEAATNTCLAVTKDVIRKTNARSETHVVWPNTVFGHASVAGEERSRGCIWKLRRAHILQSDQAGGIVPVGL